LSGTPTSGLAATSESISANYVAADASGNFYITGGYYSTIISKVDPTGILTIFAGGGTHVISNGVPATSVMLSEPYGVAADAAGNVYFTSSAQGYILKVDASGTLTIVAGTGMTGYSGDGGAATNAQLSFPSGLKLDAAGNIYIADQENGVVRKINTSGIITTIAGNHSLPMGFSGDGGAATNAQLFYPTDVAIDGAGNVYIADLENFCVRMVNTAGMISTVAGTPSSSSYSGDGGPATNAHLGYITGIACDGGGTLYIADQGNSRIRQVNNSGIITTIAGTALSGYNGDGEAATNAELFNPSSVCLDNQGNCLVADFENFRVRKFLGVSVIGPANMCVGSSDTFKCLIPGTFSWTSSAPSIATINSTTGVVSAVSPGVDTIICNTGSNTFKRIITISAPGKGMISGNNRFCIGTADSLSETMPGGAWSSTYHYAAVSSAGVLFGVAVGLDIISYNIINACGTYTAEFVVNVEDKPFAAPIKGSQLICPGHSVQLSDSIGGGSWFTITSGADSVSASGRVYGLTPGTGIIYYRLSNGCGSDTTAPFPVIVDTSYCHFTAVATIDEISSGLSLFPNPNNGHFFIKVSSADKDDLQIVITNLVGEKVFETETETNRHVEIMQNLKSGVYFITAASKNGRWTEKLVVE